MIKYILIFFCCILLTFYAPAQKIPIDESNTAHLFTPIGSAFNRIFNGSQLDSVYIKLEAIKKNNSVFRIVHIGDSHVQAGFFPGQVRVNMQDFFGNAGRGLVFPYAAIQTTSPADFTSSSNSTWKVDKLAARDEAEDVGISGYGLISNQAGANIEISLKDPLQSFTHLRFFLGNESNNGWILHANNSSFMLKPGDNKHFVSDLTLESPSSSFTVSSVPSGKNHKFFGVSIENDSPGILYHAIGVNGARYEQYNNAPFFWKQLPGLQADLYIISLGTNEAQNNKFDDGAFRKELDRFIENLKAASPHIPVIITTAPDSYKNGRSNKVLRDLNLFLFEYCTEKTIPVWDLYRVTNGYGSAFNWYRKGLMNADGVHFTSEGYQLQGQLLFNAIAKGYNDYHGF